jgi:hypothetical protein
VRMAIAIPVGEVAARVGDTTDDEQAAPADTSPATTECPEDRR